MSAAPRAAGVHLSYAEAPAAVRAWVEESLGSPVVTAAGQVGGMSPGCVARLVCADGSRAFVKAVGRELNPESPAFYRREITALGLLGSHPLWGDLLASYDDGGWVALLIEDVEGRHPDLGDDAEMAHLLSATDELVGVLQARVPDPPAPDPGNGGLNDLGLIMTQWTDSLDRIDDNDLAAFPDLLPAWVRRQVDGLRRLVAPLRTVRCDHLVHWDIRNDNLLLRPSGDLVFLDWGAAGIGPGWLDPLLARLERVHLPWFDDSLTSSPALAEVGDDLVTAWLVAFGTHLAVRAATVVDVNLPTLGEFRRTESARFLAAAARRLGQAPSI